MVNVRDYMSKIPNHLSLLLIVGFVAIALAGCDVAQVSTCINDGVCTLDEQLANSCSDCPVIDLDNELGKLTNETVNKINESLIDGGSSGGDSTRDVVNRINVSLNSTDRDTSLALAQYAAQLNTTNTTNTSNVNKTDNIANRPRSILGGPCSRAADCPAYSMCSYGKCLVTNVQLDGVCSVNQTCIKSLECVDGSCKVAGTSGQSIVPSSNLRQMCSSTQACSVGFECVNSMCEVLAPACVAESNITFCARLTKNCGVINATDNCGDLRLGVVCGQCAAAMLCANNTCVDNSCSSSNADGLCATDMVCYGGQCVNQSVADCANDPKCSTKNCDSGDCSKPGVWQRLISWLKGLIS